MSECVIEIVGEALKVGPKVTLVKPGQRVGVGAQSWSCLDCKQCANDNETYCESESQIKIFPGFLRRENTDKMKRS